MREAGYQPAPDLKTYFNNQPKKNHLAPGTFGCAALLTVRTPPTQRSSSINLLLLFNMTMI